jgi:nucleolar protein 53
MQKSKLPEQVTRSQRNKRARHKQMEMEHQARRKEKSIIKQINTCVPVLEAFSYTTTLTARLYHVDSVHHIAREVERDEKESEKKQELKKLREEQKLNEEPLVRVAGKLTYTLALGTMISWYCSSLTLLWIAESQQAGA